MTENATELFQAGRLADAVAHQIQEVKAHPADTFRRGFLTELLCFGENLERVDTHINVIEKQEPNSAPALAGFRQLIRAEMARRECLAEGRVPSFVGDASPLMQRHLRALASLRAGDAPAALAELTAAEEERPRLSGVCDGQAFAEFRDLDDLTASFLEVLASNGNYYWIPFDAISEISFDKPERSRDLLWRPASLTVRDGPEGDVFVPALYDGSYRADDERLALGRATDWQGGETEPVRGVGQRMFLIGNEARSIMEIGDVTFGTAGETA